MVFSKTTAWIEEAARLPLAFAQVREDPRVELRLLDTNASVILVASGGCTAAALAAAGAARLHLVDPNPAQIALARLKLELLKIDPPERMALLGHTPMLAREARLRETLDRLDLQLEELGPAETVVELGPDQAGRYERLFARLREALEIHSLDEAFDRVMALPILVRLFGGRATANRVQPFARHFARRTRGALGQPDAARNPYLAQVLDGCFLNGNVTPWLEAPRRSHLPLVTHETAPMAEALCGRRADMVHLSNILDWLAPPEAADTLDRAWRALRPGGVVVIRQLNSTLRIRELDGRFVWSDSPVWDRSYFYRAHHIGVKR